MSQDHRLFSPLQDLLHNRLNHIISLEFFEISIDQKLQIVIFVCIGVVSYLQRKHVQYRRIYFILSYYFFCFLIISLYSRTLILFHFVYLLIPLTYIWLASLLTGRNKLLITTIIVFIYLANLHTSLNYISYLQKSFINKSPNSWIGLSNVAQKVIDKQNGKPFGYFVYAPDAFAYQPRYAMLYNFAASSAKANEYTKETTTYVIAQPPPRGNPYMGYTWWIKVPVAIANKPISTETFSNG